MASGYAKISSEERENGHYSNYGTNSSAKIGFAKGSSTEFFQICDKITTNLFTINKAATVLDKSKKQIGTATDSQQLRDRIHKENSDAGGTIQDTTSLLGSIHLLTQGDKQRKIRAQRLQSEFQAAATRFSEVQKKVLMIVRTARLPSDMVAAEQDAESNATENMVREGELIHAQRQEIHTMEFEVAMQQEREHQVRGLESDIIDINDIMRQLSMFVSAQGELVDSIENNVEVTHGHVEEGREELVKAQSYMNKYRRKLCLLLTILLIVLFIIGIILAVHFTGKN